MDRSVFCSQNNSIMSGPRFLIASVICLSLGAPAWAGHALAPREQRILLSWLSAHPHFQAATDEDCHCAEDIRQMRVGSGGVWRPVPDYRPYVATGDLNGDGICDFAVAVIEQTKTTHQFVLLVFNGPFESDSAAPAFIERGLDLRFMGLSFGPPRPKPYRLIMGRFDSDNTSMLVPYGQSYKLR